MCARELYERDLVLVRPDLHIVWRGNTVPQEYHRIVASAIGFRAGGHVTLSLSKGVAAQPLSELDEDTVARALRQAQRNGAPIDKLRVTGRPSTSSG
jgi:hypothetical protein